jgi:DNA-binding phage protein
LKPEAAQYLAKARQAIRKARAVAQVVISAVAKRTAGIYKPLIQMDSRFRGNDD